VVAYSIPFLVLLGFWFFMMGGRRDAAPNKAAGGNVTDRPAATAWPRRPDASIDPDGAVVAYARFLVRLGFRFFMIGGRRGAAQNNDAGAVVRMDEGPRPSIRTLPAAKSGPFLVRLVCWFLMMGRLGGHGAG
jgi:hypothetical protein